MSNIIHDKSDLAQVLTTMPFGVLMQVAHELVSMVAEANAEEATMVRDLSTPVGMAEMLYDWADAQDTD